MKMLLSGRLKAQTLPQFDERESVREARLESVPRFGETDRSGVVLLDGTQRTFHIDVGYIPLLYQ